MIDRIVRINYNEVLIVFDAHPPFRITSSAGNAVQLALWLLSPSRLTITEFTRAVTTNIEETDPCITLKVA